MFDYFNSTKKANQILARVAKKAFKSAETKPTVKCRGNSTCLASGKIILRLSKLDSVRWKVCAPLKKKPEYSEEKIIASDDIFNPSSQKNKEKLAKKRKLDDKSLQVEKGRAEDRIPRKKFRLLSKNIKSSKKEDIRVSSELKSSTRRSKRLATKVDKKQKFEESAVTDLLSAIVSQPSKRKNSTKNQSCSNIKPQNLRSSSNVPS